MAVFALSRRRCGCVRAEASALWLRSRGGVGAVAAFAPRGLIGLRVYAIRARNMCVIARKNGTISTDASAANT